MQISKVQTGSSLVGGLLFQKADVDIVECRMQVEFNLTSVAPRKIYFISFSKQRQMLSKLQDAQSAGAIGNMSYNELISALVALTGSDAVLKNSPAVLAKSSIEQRTPSLTKSQQASLFSLDALIVHASLVWLHQMTFSWRVDVSLLWSEIEVDDQVKTFVSSEMLRAKHLEVWRFI